MPQSIVQQYQLKYSTDRCENVISVIYSDAPTEHINFL